MSAGLIEAGLQSVNGITNLIGSGQRRKAQQAEHRNQMVQMILASRMQQNQQNPTQNGSSNPIEKSNTGFLIGGLALIIIVLIGIIVWKQQQKA